MPSWSQAHKEFGGVIERTGPGVLYLKPPAMGPNLAFTLTVNGVLFQDTVPAGLDVTPIPYAIPLECKGDLILTFTSSDPVLVTWKEKKKKRPE